MFAWWIGQTAIVILLVGAWSGKLDHSETASAFDDAEKGIALLGEFEKAWFGIGKAKCARVSYRRPLLLSFKPNINMGVCVCVWTVD